MKARTWLLLGCVPLLANNDGLTDRRTDGSSAVVTPAIDVLLRDSLHLIAGKRVGLITHRAAVDAIGTLVIDRLAASPARLTALFAPEHGLRGTAAPGERVNDSVDATTGIPIYSLYGASRAPSAEQLATIEVLLVDLQDVGARPYTYVSTAVLALRAAKAAGVPVVVLDRPNPIGCLMGGPVLEERNASFIGMLPVPLRHGMTIGELVRFANRELDIDANLRVIPLEGWRRCMWFEETGLPFVPPSPNLPDLESVAWFPGIVLFEATNLSVGRGTDAPFRQVGAPWVDLSRWDLLPALEDTVSFTPRAPGDGKYNGVPVQGVRLARLMRTGDPIETAVRLLARFDRIYGDSMRVDSAGMRLRLGIGFDESCPGVQCLPDASLNHWPAEIARFRLRARRYFLYL